MVPKNLQQYSTQTLFITQTEGVEGQKAGSLLEQASQGQVSHPAHWACLAGVCRMDGLCVTEGPRAETEKRTFYKLQVLPQYKSVFSCVKINTLSFARVM